MNRNKKDHVKSTLEYLTNERSKARIILHNDAK